MTEAELDAFVAQQLAAGRRAEAAAVRRGAFWREMGRRQAAHAGVWGSDPPAPRAPAEAAPAEAAGLDPNDPIERRIAERLDRLKGLVDGLVPGPDPTDGQYHHRIVSMGLDAQHTAQVIAAAAAQDLGLPPLTVRFFAPARKAAADSFLATDEPIWGVVRPITQAHTVFIRADLAPRERAQTIFHEARHLWQVQAGRATGVARLDAPCEGALDADAVAYQARALDADGLAATALRVEEQRLAALGPTAAAAEERRLAAHYGLAA